MMTPVVAAPMRPAPAVTMPAYFCGRRDFILHRLSGTGIDQRHRLRALDWRGEDEQRASGRKAEHFQGLHFRWIS